MLFTEEKAAEVKSWVVKKLEDISDADSEVLADYVLALVSTDAPDDEIRKASIENLEDFLKENTVTFVDEIFTKFHSRPEEPAVAPTTLQSGLAAPVQNASPSQQTPTSDMMAHFAPSDLGPMSMPGLTGFGNSDQQFNARKRTFNDSQMGDDQGPYQRSADRPFKAARGRRGGRGGMGGWDSRQHQGTQGQGYSPSGFRSGPSVPPPSFSPFNPNDPLAQMLSLSGMSFPQIPGMPPLPPLPSLNGQSSGPPNKIPERCKDYDTMGFCVLGSTCPYEHGQDHLVAASKDDEYDPTRSNIVSNRPANGTNGQSEGRGDRGRGRGRGRGDRGGFGQQRRNRAEFSHAGPNEDRKITTIVVEQIPEDKFDEETIREFFSEFGEITEITMKPYKHLALVKYDSYDAAHRAWSSPKVIFDNRFVKVYWYKSTETRGDSNGTKAPTNGEPSFDREAFEKQQAEAQKAHEERARKRKETEDAILEHKRKTDELLKRHKEEQAKLLEKLEAKGAGKDTPESGKEASKSDQTASLRAQLASLQAEAKSMGIDPDAQPEPSFGRGRGRGFGGPRGRGAFAPRGRGFDPSYRGGYRGRGGLRGRGGVIRLDNRPKRVAISGIDFDTNRDEALRQYLMGVGDYESVETSPDRPGAVVVTFKDRYVAEKLFHGPSDIPSVGKVNFAWVSNPPAPSTHSSASIATQKANEDVMMSDSGTPGALMQEKEPTHEVDYDVAEMDDAWAE